jgi:hypothetical protein
MRCAARPERLRTVANRGMFPIGRTGDLARSRCLSPKTLSGRCRSSSAAAKIFLIDQLRTLYRDRLFGHADADREPARLACLSCRGRCAGGRDRAATIASQILVAARYRRMAGETACRSDADAGRDRSRFLFSAALFRGARPQTRLARLPRRTTITPMSISCATA